MTDDTAKIVSDLANELLTSNSSRLEIIRMHSFDNDDEAHNDAATHDLVKEFCSEVDRLLIALSNKYGDPLRTGYEDDEAIPLSGIFRFGVWLLCERLLFIAAAHEDRGLPILLMIGTAD